MKVFFLSVFIFFLVLQVPGMTQAHLLEGGEFVFNEFDQCLSSKNRREINSRLKTQIAKLDRVGLNKQLNQEAAVSFGSPIRKSSLQQNQNFYAIRNYVDHNPSATGAQFGSSNLDYNCGVRTYDTASGYNHQGTDFCSWPFPWHAYENNLMEVVAAEAGQVIGIDDGNPDNNCDCINNFDLWNAIYIRHADGSVAWYGHLKAGIDKVVGQMVQKGELLGIVGSSGCSTDPHLHFEVYDSGGNLIDPFFGNCNSMNSQSWWSSQEEYFVPQINALLTHFAPPEVGCPAVNESTNFSNCFHPGETIYIGSYYRDQSAGSITNIRIHRPNGTIQNSWNFTSPQYYSFSFWYWYVTLSSTEPYGMWKVEFDYLGVTYDHEFEYTAGDCNCVTAYSLANGNRLSGGVSNSMLAESDGIIESRQVIGDNSTSPDAVYDSGSSIQLLSGFEVSTAAVFHALINGCGN